jgi:hypothetical protein
MPAVRGLIGVEALRRRVGEEGFDFGEGCRPVFLERQQVIAAALADRLGDGALGSHGVDGDQGAAQLEAFEQPRPFDRLRTR